MSAGDGRDLSTEFMFKDFTKNTLSLSYDKVKDNDVLFGRVLNRYILLVIYYDYLRQSVFKPVPGLHYQTDTRCFGPLSQPFRVSYSHCCCRTPTLVRPRRSKCTDRRLRTTVYHGVVPTIDIFICVRQTPKKRCTRSNT